MQYRSISLLAAFATLFGCSPNDLSGDDGACKTNADCSAGFVCDPAASGSGCRAICQTHSDCPGDLLCNDDGACREATDGTLPVIHSVIGNGAVSNKVLDGLLVEGAVLAGANFDLEGDDFSARLAIRSQSDSSAELILPADIRTGQYTLIASNAAGSAQDFVQLELPDVTGNLVITRINDGSTTERISLDRLASPVQRRVSGVCDAGQSISEIAEDGSVVCEDIAAVASSALDQDGDGFIDAGLLPTGFFHNRVLNARQVSHPGIGAANARDVTFVKHQPDTLLEVTSMHSGGARMDGAGVRLETTDFSIDDRLFGRSGSHASSAAGWRLFPQTSRFYVSDIPAGVHRARVDFRLDNGLQYLYAWTGSNFFEVREVPLTERREVVTFSTDIRNTSTSMISVQDRGITYTKSGDASVPLLITLHDTWGSNASAGSAPGCRWQLFMDGSPLAGTMDLHADAAGGWTIYPSTVGWIVDGLAADAYYFELRVQKYADSTQCLNGWTSNGFISAYELDPNTSAYAKDFGDFRTTSTTWVPVDGRQVDYTKQVGSTDLRITWMDNSGYSNGNYHTNACFYRVLMDGEEVARTGEHNSNIGSWRLMPKMASFIIEDAAVGSHTFQLEAQRYLDTANNRYGATECRAGWGNGAQAANFLLVEETPSNK